MNQLALRIVPANEQHKPGSDGLERRVTARLNDLSKIVYTPDTRAVDQVCRYLMDYCGYYTDLMLQLPLACPRVFNQLNAVDDLLELSAPTGSSGCLMLLRHAYFSLRVVEELNDASVEQSGQPLSDFDLATANLVVGALLDSTDVVAIESLVSNICRNSERYFPGRHWQLPASSVVRICQAWPCLSDHLGMPSILA